MFFDMCLIISKRFYSAVENHLFWTFGGFGQGDAEAINVPHHSQVRMIARMVSRERRLIPV
ncbi:hypothetical protein ACVWXQ_003826 [Bradyrhizobium sp. S3.14.4]